MSHSAGAGSASDASRGAHRPVPLPDLSRAQDAGAPAGSEPFARAERASATAAAVLAAAQSGEDPGRRARLVSLAETVGLDTLAELWRDSEPDTLPGALWALYLVRVWCRADGPGVARLWQAGRALAPADQVVAGVSDDADPQAFADLADAVLTGAYGGDFGVALERAAAFFRVVAEGRRALAADDDAAELERAARNDRVGHDLATAAKRWRRGQLS